MPGDLAVPSVPLSRPSGSAANPDGARGAHQVEPVAGPATTAGAAALYTNPVSRLDPALGIVVLDFYNEQGVETSSIPTQKQLESYRLHGDPAPPDPTSALPNSRPDG
jgi:hypothetical protein